MPAGALTQQQTATKDYLVFADFETMDTHVAREAMPQNRLAWCENLQIIGPNQLTVVPAPNPALATIAGKTAGKMWGIFLQQAGTIGVDYQIVFETDGSMQAVNVASGAVTQVAPPGTFSNPDVTIWNSAVLSAVVIADPVAGYCAWNGTALSKVGGVSPAFNIVTGGSGYGAPPVVTITGTQGTGAAAVATLSGTSVASLQLNSGGQGYFGGAIVAIVGPTTLGSGATATATVVGGAITALTVVAGGANYPAGPLTIYVGGTGIGAFATATVVGGAITSYTMTAGGNNYVAGAPIVINSVAGSGATATSTAANGIVTSLNLTAGGSGYPSAPQVVLQGIGTTGAGATATSTIVGGVVTAINLTNAGNGFRATDQITVTVAPPGGVGSTQAIVTGRPWPSFSITPTTLAVYQGRVWLAGGRTLAWTGTGGLDDANLADASGSTSIPDADLVHGISALRALNNFLWIFGDQSIKQIGSVSVSGSTTVFSIVTLSSDTGTIFPQTILSYQRLVLFANTTGVYAVLGASVQKVSEEMDGIFRQIDFSVKPCAALNDINNIRCYLLLVRYIDPARNVTRTLLLTFQAKKWFVCSQGDNLLTMASSAINSTSIIETFASSGPDVTEILQNTVTPVAILLQTALAHHNKPHMGKRALRAATAQLFTNVTTIAMTIDTENGSVPEPYTLSAPIIWLNALNQVVTWLNALSQLVTFSGSGFLFQRTPAAGTGIYLGLTLKGTVTGYSFNNGIIEYQEATALASKTSA